MNERQIECFLSVARSHSFSAASQALFISQPAVSYQIKSLEKELGVTLFTRDTPRTELTSAGRIFWEDALHCEKVFWELRQHLLPYADVEQTLVLGCPRVMLSNNENALFQIVQRAEALPAPLRLRSKELTVQPTYVTQLLQGDVDLMFSDIDLPEVQSPEMAHRFLFNSSAYICVHEAHALARHDRVISTDLAGERLIFHKENKAFLSSIADCLGRAGLRPDIQLHDSFAQSLAYLRPEHSVTFYPCSLPLTAPIRFVPFVLDRPVRIGMVWLRERETPSLRRLIDLIDDLPKEIWKASVTSSL